jgi:hypothetical protein
MSIVQVVCNDSGESHYPDGEWLPDAREYRFTCPEGCMCGAAEYREPEGIEA